MLHVLDRFRSLVLLGALAALLAGCSSSPTTEVRDNYDPDTDWSQVRTFVWLGIQAQRGYNEFDVKRIANAIQDELQRKGLEIVPDETFADVAVAAYLGIRPKAVDTWKYTSGALWTKEKELVSAGALIVDVVDLRTRSLIWQGQAERQLQDNPTPARTEKNIKEVVKKLLADFPPSS